MRYSFLPCVVQPTAIWWRLTLSSFLTAESFCTRWIEKSLATHVHYPHQCRNYAFLCVCVNIFYNKKLEMLNIEKIKKLYDKSIIQNTLFYDIEKEERKIRLTNQIIVKCYIY